MQTSYSQKPRRERVRLLECCLLLAVATLFFLIPSALAQNEPGYFDATTLRQPTDLSSIWLIHAGDDPNGSRGWARPDFDDSSWTPCDPTKSLRNYFPQGNPGIVWYRLHLKVAPSQTDLALREIGVSSAVVGFTNGTQIFHVGQIAPFLPYTSQASIIAGIPADQIATGSVVIALRVHISTPDWNNILPGLAPSNLILGQEDTLRDRNWIYYVGAFAGSFLDALTSLGLGIAAILLYSADARRKEYLWLALWCACGVLTYVQFAAELARNIPVSWLSISLLVYFTSGFAAVRMYLSFIGQAGRGVLTAIVVVSSFLSAYASTDQLSFFALTANQLFGLQVSYYLIIAIVVPFLLLREWSRGRREAGILLIPLALNNLFLISFTLLSLLTQLASLREVAIGKVRLLSGTSLAGFYVSPNIVTDILSDIALALIILLRTNRLSRQGALFENELAAARLVQQVLVPEAIETIAGFAIEAAYLPAQQVGGDFFQILPTPAGGLLLVIGDVAGKGLPAAMLVSVLVGAVRTIAEYTHAPDKILAQLNARMLGRCNGGFSTALAAHITCGGEVTISNAGHLCPYIDGNEVELPGAIPLGVLGVVTYPTSSFKLLPASRVTFYSDGVVEAQDAQGKLFGFDRGQAISTLPAGAIAEEARTFGQSDDITVITVTRASS